jgi:hypothetical protein
MADSISINLDDLELGEIEELENTLEVSLGELDLTSARVMVHLIWIAKRRDDPTYTLDDARKIKLSQLQDDDEGGEVPPTPAASKPAGNGRRKSGAKQA